MNPTEQTSEVNPDTSPTQGFYVSKSEFLELKRALSEQTSEVARLHKAISSALNSVSAENWSDTPDFILAEFLTECLMAWNKATKKRNDWHSPEETQDGVTMAEWYDGFSKIESTEAIPEWRDFTGTDETIQEGDKYRSDVSLSNWPVTSAMLGKPARNFSEYRFFTHRPLPRKEEIMTPDGVSALALLNDKPTTFPHGMGTVEGQEAMPLDNFNYHLILCEDAGENSDLLHCLRSQRIKIKCDKCKDTGWYFYDQNHATVCDKCCDHDKGWLELSKEHHGNHYVDGADNGCCLNGCGTMRRNLLIGSYLPHIMKADIPIEANLPELK